MMEPCKHWSELSPLRKPVLHGGYCSRDQKRVSDGICRGCRDNPDPKLWPLTVTAKPTPPLPPPPPHGLGNLARQKIDLVTLGTGELVASTIARVFLARKCSCEARARCLDRLVPDVREVEGAAAWTMLLPRILLCLGATEQNQAGTKAPRSA
jgi:hypothetical protein